MKLLIRNSLFAIGFTLTVLGQASAQPGDPGGGVDPDVPITGIEWLLALGTAFGVRKLFQKKDVD